MATMSKVSGARYSTLAPVSFAARSTPFLTTDQNGSLAWPWLTTMISVAIAAGAAASNEAIRVVLNALLIVFSSVVELQYAALWPPASGCAGHLSRRRAVRRGNRHGRLLSGNPLRR